MPVWTRLKFVAGSITAVSVVALIYATAGKELIRIGTNGSSGLFSGPIRQIDNLIPPLLGLLLLGALVYLVYGSAQEERTVRQRPPRRRP